MRYTVDNFVTDWPEQYAEQIKVITDKGFNVLGVGTMMCEDTFVFETQKEASEAYAALERNDGNFIGLVVGWWYGKDTVEESARLMAVDMADVRPDYKLTIHWKI